MQELTIRCSCGRSMNPEYRRGAGAYRCGCGIRIDVTIPPTANTKCWFTGCSTVAVTDKPLVLCREHEKETAMRVAYLVADRSLWLDASAYYRPLDNYGAPKPTAHTEESSWVYFMRRETLIKIGYSCNLSQRANALGATILATIPGGPSAEARLHERFDALRDHGEWFHPGDELIAYINELRKTKRDAPIHA